MILKGVVVGLEVQENNRKRLPAASREALNALAAMHSLLCAYEDQFMGLFGRANDEDGYWKIKYRLEKDLDAILDTIPIEQLKTIKHAIDIATIHVGVRAAGKRPDSMWVISYDDLADLAEYATKTQCMACNQMHKPCRLRDILKELPIEGVEKLVVGCWED